MAGHGMVGLFFETINSNIMPLQLKGAASQASDGTQIYIEFLEATGTYDVDDNPGGFGAPNPARNTLAIVIFAEHKLVAGDQDADVLQYNPLTVASFTININKAVNGVINWVIMALPIFDDEVTYSNGTVVWDNTNPIAPIIKKMVDSEWVVKTLEEAANDSTVTKVDEYSFPIPDAITFANELNASRLKLLRAFVNKQCGKDEYVGALINYQYVDALMISAIAAFCDQMAYNEAQNDIEEIFKFQSQVLTANG